MHLYGLFSTATCRADALAPVVSVPGNMLSSGPAFQANSESFCFCWHRITTPAVFFCLCFASLSLLFASGLWFTEEPGGPGCLAVNMNNLQSDSVLRPSVTRN
jgi:hypothetical protein